MDKKENLIVISKLAWRSVWTNKRRTILTLLTTMIGYAMILVTNAIATGGHERMIEDAVAMNAGHIQVHEKEFWDNKSIEYAFKDDPGLIKKMRQMPGVEAVGKRIHAAGLLSYQDTTSGAVIQAVNPEQEKEVSTMYKNILPGGRYLDTGDTTQIVMGETLAKNMGVTVGNTVAMISQGFDGSIAAENLTLVGIFKSGNPEYDRSLVVMPFEQAKKTFSMMGFVNSLVLRIDEITEMEKIRDQIKTMVDREDYEVMGWDDLMPELVQFIVMDDVGAYIFDFVLFMVVAFGILNTIQMSVFERTREFGIMLAIGTQPSQVRGIILLESFFITCLGIVTGCILGLAISHYFAVNPLDYSNYADEMSVWGISTTMYPTKVTGLNLVFTTFFIFVLSFIFSLFPARRAAHLKPIEAIHQL